MRRPIRIDFKSSRNSLVILFGEVYGKQHVQGVFVCSLQPLALSVQETELFYTLRAARWKTEYARVCMDHMNMALQWFFLETLTASTFFLAFWALVKLGLKLSTPPPIIFQKFSVLVCAVLKISRAVKIQSEFNFLFWVSIYSHSAPNIHHFLMNVDLCNKTGFVVFLVWLVCLFVNRITKKLLAQFS